MRGHLIAGALAFALFGLIAYWQMQTAALVIEVYGVDTLFVLDILERLRAGQIAHVDFTLPIGAFPFQLSVLSEGSIAASFMIGQWVLTASLLFAGFWIGVNRLSAAATAYLLISVVLVATALSSSIDPRITLALFYNRWAWAIALVFIVAVAAPLQSGAERKVDACLVGALAFLLLSTKITFFVALVPLGLAYYALQMRWNEIAYAAATAIALGALAAVVFRGGFWIAYFDDLVWVAGNPIRQQPGQGPIALLSSPSYIGYFLVYGLFSYALYLKYGRVVFLPLAVTCGAMLFVQAQNFGNTPLWIVALGTLAMSFASLPVDHTKRRSRLYLSIVALACVALSLPTLFLFAQSTPRNANAVAGDAVELMPGIEGFGDLLITPHQISPIETRERTPSPDVAQYMGKCFATSGFLGVYREVAEALADLDAPVFIADAVSPYWIQNGAPPLLGAPPWNYGSLRGLEQAGFVAVPECPFKPSYQEEILRNIERASIALTPIDRTPFVTIMRWERR